ncbi:MAG: HU family DNA-binding protein [Bacteroidaceae bacterium]|nr:HU family DNA-binding protein [Candidatus Equimonas faecalis]MCQ2205315.1 HU family DNA-binding protein [Bacteroidaceae bacterium]
MNKTQLIEAVAAKAGITKVAAKAAVEATFETVKAAIEAGEGAQIFGFGNFSVNERPARMGVNPRNGEKVQIAAKKVVKFKAASAFNI